MWIAAVVGGLLSVLSGAVPPDLAWDVVERVGPVLLFLVAVTILAELSDLAGVFGVAAQQAARAARGRTIVLFLLVTVIATATTVLLSLDTTAVLLTPVVLTLCSQLDLDPVPFALATVWLANTTSLLLPVSNLTNLLAVGRLDLDAAEFAATMWAAAAVALLATVLVLLALFWRRLRGSYVPTESVPVPDLRLFLLCTGGCVLFAALVLAEVDVTVAAVTGMTLAVAAFALRRRDQLRWSLVPWRLVLLVLGLFLVVAAAHEHGLDGLLRSVSGTGTAPKDLLQVAGVGVVGANVVNNLPAYIALEPAAADTSSRLLALVIGVNAGPLILLWGSLATLLWRDRCAARGVHISWLRFAATGAILVPVVVVPAVLVLPR